jgi:hypothetical protein
LYSSASGESAFAEKAPPRPSASVPLAGISKPPAAADLATASTEKKSGNRKLRWDSGKEPIETAVTASLLDGKSGEGRVLARALAIAQ